MIPLRASSPVKECTSRPRSQGAAVRVRRSDGTPLRLGRFKLQPTPFYIRNFPREKIVQSFSGDCFLLIFRAMKDERLNYWNLHSGFV